MGKKKKKKAAAEPGGQPQDAQALKDEAADQGKKADKGSKKKKKKPRKPVTYTAIYPSLEVGPIMLATDGKNLTGAWLTGQKYYAATVEDEMVADNCQPVLIHAKDWLERYFAGEQPPIAELPLAPMGSEFRQRVWRKLITIPYGQTRTYGEIAAELAAEDGKETMSAQAVGGAVGHNPISVIIPCHRVVGADGSLTGYAGGIDKKVALLEHEGADMSAFTVPKKGTAL